MSTHLKRVCKQPSVVHYLGKDIQNELISLLSKKIINTIVSQIHKAKYYSIIADCPPDISHISRTNDTHRKIYKYF